MRIWDPETGRLLQTVEGQKGYVLSLLVLEAKE
jgi:hypothetical protein